MMWRVFGLLVLLLATPARAEDVSLQVMRAEVAQDTRTGVILLNVSLDADSGRSFTAFTASNVGRTIQIRVGERILSTPRLLTPMTGGVIQVVGFTDAQDAVSVSQVLEAGGRLEIATVAKSSAN